MPAIPGVNAIYRLIPHDVVNPDACNCDGCLGNILKLLVDAEWLQSQESRVRYHPVAAVARRLHMTPEYVGWMITTRKAPNGLAFHYN